MTSREEDKIAQRKMIEDLTRIFRSGGGKVTRFKMGEINPDTPFGPYSAARLRRQKAKEKRRLAKEAQTQNQD